ncbi:MAG: hypothetical protein ACYDCO_01730 [Armatimonadota bacterium]
MAFLIPIAAAVAGAAAGSAFQKKPKEPALDKQVAKQYSEYMPQINADLMQMAGGNPAYERGQFLDQAASIRRYADNQRTSSLRMLGPGGVNSMGAGNLFAGIDLDTLRMLAQNLQGYQQGRDQRKQGIYGQIAGNVGQNVGGAMQAQFGAQQNQANMMGSLGAGAGGLMQAYMLSQLQYPQTPYTTGPTNAPVTTPQNWTPAYQGEPTPWF